MKLCVTGLRGFPKVMGGIETHCEHLYTRLKALRPDLDIVVLSRAPYVGPTPYDYEGVRLQPIWTVKHKVLENAIHTFLSIFRARFVERADVLHVHGIGPGLFIPIAKALGLRVAATHHGADYNRQKWGRMSKLALRAGEGLMARCADQVICVSEESAAMLKARHPRRADNIRFIPNGAALPEGSMSNGSVLDELGLEAGRYILAVGRLVPEKGFQELVDAVERTPSAPRLVIVGGADHNDAFSRRLLARASDRVMFAGVRPRDEIAALYRAAGLFVLPSHHEGHPIVALEALCAGAPLLLSDIGPNRAIGLASANYFPVGDVEALARRLGAGAFDELRVGDPAILGRYDWGGIAERTAAALDAALAA